MSAENVEEAKLKHRGCFQREIRDICHQLWTSLKVARVLRLVNFSNFLHLRPHRPPGTPVRQNRGHISRRRSLKLAPLLWCQHNPGLICVIQVYPLQSLFGSRGSSSSSLSMPSSSSSWLFILWCPPSSPFPSVSASCPSAPPYALLVELLTAGQGLAPVTPQTAIVRITAEPK